MSGACRRRLHEKRKEWALAKPPGAEDFACVTRGANGPGRAEGASDCVMALARRGSPLCGSDSNV
eukprot:2482524-Lingulodinium_polyedra.AAC.1